MTVVENLLRLHRWQLEERRRYVTELESLAERLRTDARWLTAEIDARAAMPDPSGEIDLGDHPLGRRLIERRRKLENSIAEIEAQIADAHAAVAAAEQEVGIYELAASQGRSAASGAMIRRSRPTQGMSQPPAPMRRHGT